MTYAQLTYIAEAAMRSVDASHGGSGPEQQAVRDAVYNAVMEEGKQFVRAIRSSDRSAHSHYSKKDHV